MATLEKIRGQKKLLVGVIFGALLLFIVSIIDNPRDLFGKKETHVAATVDGSDITYNEVVDLSGSIRGGAESYDRDFQALNQLVNEQILQNEYDRLAIDVKDFEISGMLAGEKANPMVVNSFAQQFNGMTPADVLNLINNPSAYGLPQEAADEMRLAFKSFEDQLRKDLAAEKLQMMIYYAINANKLDVQAMHDEAATSYKVAYVAQPVVNATEPASDEEINAYYNEHKAEYAVGNLYAVNEPKRAVRYVMVDIAPGFDDMRAANALMTATLDKVRTQEDAIEELAYEGAMKVEDFTLTGDEVAQAARELQGLSLFLENAQEGDATMLQSGNNFAPTLNVVKLNRRENKVMSANLNQVFLDGTVMADSVLSKLSAGVDPQTIGGVAQVAPADVRFDRIDASILDSLQTLGVGKYMVVNSGNEEVAVAINSYKDPEDVYSLSVVSYDVLPSSETMDNLNTNLRDFLIAAPTSEEFTQEVAAGYGLRVYEGVVGESDPYLSSTFNDTEAFVAWAVDADPGSVSRLMNTAGGNRMGAITVVEKFSDYVPATSGLIRSRLSAQATMDKNNKTVIERLTGKGNTLEDYVALTSSESVDTLPSVNLSDPRNAVYGKIRGAKPGELVGPMTDNRGNVIVASVVETNVSDLPMDSEANANTFRQESANQLLRKGLVNFVLGSKKVDYNLHKYLTH